MSQNEPKVSQKCEKVDFFFEKKFFPESKFGHLEWKFSRISGFGGGKTQIFFRFCIRPRWARPPDWAYDLAISGRGSAKMGQKCEKVEFFSNKKFFFWSQNLVIWSGNSAEFPGLEAKKRKKSFFFGFCVRPHWARPPGWAGRAPK